MKQRVSPQSLLWAAAGVGGGLALYSAARKAMEWKLVGKVVAVTGGTRGLGLQMAREFAGEKCHLAICARDPQELWQARTELEALGARVLATVVDVSCRNEAQDWIDEVSAYFGRIDVLVNNAGTIQVGPAQNMEFADFQQAMDLMFYGVLHPILAVLPQLKNRHDGAIVNITSVGGKIAVPHLLPYCCAKFAATALSEGLHAELKSSGIHVLTVVPGLMRTGSYVNAYFRGQLEQEMEWFANSAMSPLLAMEPREAARQIVRALKRREAEVILTANAQLAARAHGAFPGLAAGILSAVSRTMLPAPGEGPKTKGIDIQRQSQSPAVKDLQRRNQPAAERYHQPA